MSLTEVRSVKAAYWPTLMGKENVVSCGVGFKQVAGRRTNRLAVVVGVSKKYPRCGGLDSNSVIPQTVGGVETDVVEMGVIRALGPTDRHRPAPGGVSIGHMNVTAGTLGCLVSKGGELFILSNNHVLAESNLGRVGDPIIQPGAYDGGTVEKDTIATLWEWVEIMFLFDQLPECEVAEGVASLANWLAWLTGSDHRLRAYQDDPLGMNLVDAAIARPISEDVVTREILGIGFPAGSAEAELDMEVQGSGRTSGLTMGKVLYLDSTVQVTYPGNRLALMTDQIGLTAMLEPGDSGSAILTMAMDRKVVGLGFAGSTEVAYANKIQNVEELLDVTVAT